MAKEKITLTRPQTIALAALIIALCVVGFVFNLKKIKSQGSKLQEMTTVQVDSTEASGFQEMEMEEE